MSFTNWGIRTWDPTEEVSLHGASLAQASSLNTKVVGHFTDVGARDVAFTGMSSGAKGGAVCYIVNRGGHCYWDATSNDWEWLSVHRKVMGGVRASAANTNSVTPGPVILSDDCVLPPGNRLLHITASGNMTNLSGTATNMGRLFVTGAGLNSVDGRLQAVLPPSTDTTLARSWYQVVNGTVNVSLYALAQSDAAGVSFTNTWLQAFDLGPCDD